MRVEIWSDVVCPWCYIGKRNFESALAQFEHRDEVEVLWRSFELDPHGPIEREGDYATRIARKYGMGLGEAKASLARMTSAAAAVGLDFRFDVARFGNTFDAHRLIHLGNERGIGDAVKERLLRATFTEGEPIGDRDTLVRLGADAGLDKDEAATVLEDGTYADAVRADETEAEELGITAVPFFVVDRRIAASGAQAPEVLLQLLEQGRPVGSGPA